MTRDLIHSWRNGDAQCCQLSDIADPFSDFFPFKKAPKPYFVSENRRYCHVSARSCCTSTCAHTSLSASAQFSERWRGAVLSVKHRYVLICCFSNFTCKYSRNHSTAIVFILCVFDLIRRRSIIRIFVQINILKRRSFLCSLMGRVLITIPFYDNRNSKYISGGPLSALTCCVNVRLLSAIKKISPLIYSQSWVGSWVYTTQAMMTFTLKFLARMYT